MISHLASFVSLSRWLPYSCLGHWDNHSSHRPAPMRLPAPQMILSGIRVKVINKIRRILNCTRKIYIRSILSMCFERQQTLADARHATKYGLLPCLNLPTQQIGFSSFFYSDCKEVPPCIFFLSPGPSHHCAYFHLEVVGVRFFTWTKSQSSEWFLQIKIQTYHFIIIMKIKVSKEMKDQSFIPQPIDTTSSRKKGTQQEHWLTFAKKGTLVNFFVNIIHFR